MTPSPRSDGRYFNPRSSCEERRRVPRDVVVRQRNFNPRSSCEERLAVHVHRIAGNPISIHAPHARSDLGRVGGRQALGISIHAPHARSDCINFRH